MKWAYTNFRPRPGAKPMGYAPPPSPVPPPSRALTVGTGPTTSWRDALTQPSPTADVAELSDAVKGHFEPWDEFDEPPAKPGTTEKALASGFRLGWAVLPVVLSMLLVEDVRVAVDAHRDGNIGGILIFSLLVVTIVNAMTVFLKTAESFDR